MKLISRGFPLAVIVTVVVGCAAGNADPPGPGTAGQGGPGTAGTTGAAGVGAAGTGGAGGCVAPPVVQVSWSLMTGASTSSPKVSCAQANVKYIQFFLDTKSTKFDCSPGSGMSTDFLPGTYTPRIYLLSGTNDVIFQGTAPQAVTVPSCGVASIGGFSIVITPTGAGGSGGTGGTGAAGAGGSGGTTGAGGTGGSTGAAGTGGGTGPCNALPIFAIHSCATMACHDANGTSANFNMASPGWEKNLVGKMPKAGGGAGFNSACAAAGKAYLVANSAPATGLFLDKLMGKPVCGLQMPLLTSYLSATELDCVQRWANGITKP